MGNCLLALLGLSFELTFGNHQFLFFIRLSLLLFDSLLLSLKLGFGGRCVIANDCAGQFSTRGSKDGEVTRLHLGHELVSFDLFEMRSMTPSVSSTDETSTSWEVSMVMVGGYRELGDLVRTRFLGCKWLFEVVVMRVVLCQHPTPKVAHHQ